MLSRRAFLIGSALAVASCDVLARRLLIAGGGGSFTPPPCTGSGGSWTATGAATLKSNLAASLANNAFTVTVAGSPVEVGYRPASVYDNLWTRDHAYALWHQPTLKTSAERTQFAAHRLTTASSNVVADYITATGTATYLTYAGGPMWDNIIFVVLALWADWNLTADASTFTANQSTIDACLAAVPRSGNGCVYSDPGTPIVDYGFTDTILKTGDCAYGTALIAWAYKMCAQMAGESGSGTYTTAKLAAMAGLATLRQSSGWYKGSSVNNASVDDVWATALAVAEGLIASPTDCRASAQTIASAYLDGAIDGTGAWASTITQYGLVRHLPVGQFWTGTSVTAGTYQNGGYWPTPVWDCVRAVDVVDPTTARTWVADMIAQYNAEYTAESDWTKVPYEWHNYGVGVGAKGYSPHAALVNRFV